MSSVENKYKDIMYILVWFVDLNFKNIILYINKNIIEKKYVILITKYVS